MTEILLFALLAIGSVILVLLLKKQSTEKDDDTAKLLAEMLTQKTLLESLEKRLREEFATSREESGKSAKANREELAGTLKNFEEAFTKNTKQLNDFLTERFGDFHRQQALQNEKNVELLKTIHSEIEKQLTNIRKDNTDKLEEMRKTVDEKLQSTLEERLSKSFEQVSKQLEQVYKSLGEIKNLETGINKLGRVLSNVKTRGVLGEYQLGAILEDMLTPDQYAVNVATKRGSQANVEYAVKLPGQKDGNTVWLPIDSKFPLDKYEYLLQAYETAIPEEIEKAQKDLLRTVEGFAKDISSKYLDPPQTTDFAILFLPTEGLYAEVLRHPGLFETLQRKYRITVTGPTTLAALLNSLQIGFKTLAIQKRTSEVWEVLKAVKTEFGKFSGLLEKTAGYLNKASNTIDELKGQRTRAIARKLKEVDSISEEKAQEILGLDEANKMLEE